MATTVGYTTVRDARGELARLLRGVRNRWRLRVAMRGAAVVLGAGFVVLAVSALLLDQLRYEPGAVIALRLVLAAAVGALIAWFVARPLVRSAPDDRVALYVEEHEPSLQAALVSAVEVSAARAGAGTSDALARRVVEGAVERTRAIGADRRVEQDALRRTGGALAGVLLAVVLATALGPAVLRTGARALLLPWRDADSANPYGIAVTPGSVTVARGADLEIAAQLRGFASQDVEVAVRRGTGAWERVPMELKGAAAVGAAAGKGADSGATAGASADDSSTFALRLFDIDSTADYFVEANGVRSPVYRISVADLPTVKRLDLEYRFPAYTGLEPKVEEDGGDIAALKGTVVRVRAITTIPAGAGRLVVEGRDPIPMQPGADGVLAGDLPVERDGFYKVELQAADGRMVSGSLDYSIDVLADQPPTVSLSKPGRDVKVTALEEVFAEARASDDFGVSKLELVYSVNGGGEKAVPLSSGGGRGTKDLSAGHTFFLEEFGLKPGDFVSYYARAADRTGQTATTDIYFMQIRPFGQDYRQAEQGGGMQGGGAQDDSPGAMSERQRQIIAGTFKVERDRAGFTDKELRENLATLALAQGRLREQVEGLARRMVERGVAEADSGFRVIAEELPKAAEAMGEAEEQLGGRRPKQALGPEQKALQHLQRAEAAFREVRVSFNQQQGGGGGSQQQLSAEDLADLFELEADKLRNQYESVQRGQQRQQDNQVDEVMERLRQLAARQQQEDERMRRRASSARPQNQQGGGGGSSQRQLAEETEELARRLERLARENPTPELNETARRLKEAADAMRRASAANQEGSLGESAAAANRLQEARRLLENSRTGRLERDVKDALSRAEQLAEEQRDVGGETEKVTTGQGTPERAQRLGERKDALAGGVEELEQQLDRMARESRRDQPDAARKLQEAADAIRDNKVKEKIRYSKGFLRGRAPAEYARNFEGQIGENLDEVRQKIAEAAGSVGRSAQRDTSRALDRARDLVRGMESLDERMREQAGGRERGQQGREGQ
ncbi:MAG TPA: DUF4175 family protein, partial [Gemmatimonadaceae bacterium]|nr:DUF4175 family protein [Gemmatimonadaceae bacterium]